MGEENTFNSSQESLPLSQDTFEYLWNEMCEGTAPLMDQENVAEMPISNETGIGQIKMEVELDSSDIVPNDAIGTNLIPTLAQIGAISATIQVPSPSTSPPLDVITHHAPSSLPASESWPGQFNFQVSFGPQEKNTKGVAWTYSEIKDKLYVGKDAPCPINFSTNAAMPDGVVIRAMALYNSPEQVSEIVHRCVNHSMEEIRLGKYEAEHLIRCESSMVTYHTDNATKRHSVVVPFENPPVGQDFSTYIFKFVCFGSCAGGPNRRPIMIVFTLEKGNQVIGRRKLDLKICACPGRDKKAEEQPYLDEKDKKCFKRKESHKLVNLSDTLDFVTRNVYYPPAKKSKVCSDKNGHYVITTDDPECYEFLKQMKKLYEICKVMKNLNPDLKKALLNFQKKNEESE